MEPDERHPDFLGYTSAGTPVFLVTGGAGEPAPGGQEPSGDEPAAQGGDEPDVQGGVEDPSGQEPQPGQEPQEPAKGEQPEGGEPEEPSEGGYSLEELLGDLPVDVYERLPDNVQEWSKSVAKTARDANREAKGLREQVKWADELVPDTLRGQMSGQEYVQAIHQQIATDEGLRDLFWRILDQEDAHELVGLSNEQIEQLKQAQSQPPAKRPAASPQGTQPQQPSQDGEADQPDDVRKLVREELSTFEQEQQRKREETALNAKLDELNVTDPSARQMVSNFAVEAIKDGTISLNGDRLQAQKDALDEGMKRYQDFLDKQHEAYIAKKQKDAKVSSPGGSQGGSQPSAPKVDKSQLSRDELREAARQELLK